jgi:hypothetical protein
VDLDRVAGVPGKIEGVAVTGRNTLALINDNDFGMTDGAEAFDADGRLVDSEIETSLTVVELPHLSARLTRLPAPRTQLPFPLRTFGSLPSSAARAAPVR